MTRLSLTTCAILCLLLSAGCTSAPKPPIPEPTACRPECPLVVCRLPGRPAVVANEGWQRAVDELEAELLSCAAQVLDCIERQGVRE